MQEGGKQTATAPIVDVKPPVEPAAPGMTPKVPTPPPVTVQAPEAPVEAASTESSSVPVAPAPAELTPPETPSQVEPEAEQVTPTVGPQATATKQLPSLPKETLKAGPTKSNRHTGNAIFIAVMGVVAAISVIAAYVVTN